MITTIVLVLAAQFFSALSVLGDKFLISNSQLKSPIVYAFYISILSGVVLFMIPFGGVSFPGPTVILLSYAVAASYILSILCLYYSLKQASADEVVPVIGAVTAISTFVLKFFLFGHTLPHNFFIASILLVAGMALVSHYKFPKVVIYYMLSAGILFSISSILTKEIFELPGVSFSNAFFWTRIANVIGALLIIMIPQNFRLIFGQHKTVGTKTTFFVVVNKILGALAFILIFYAIQFGNISIINALASLQFVFLFIFALIFSKRFPTYFSDEIHKHEFYHKMIAILIILTGFFMLFS